MMIINYELDYILILYYIIILESNLMVRKINKKSRRNISRRRRGVVNKRTLRRNKSRVGGKIKDTCILNPCPKFTFEYNNSKYSIEKKPGVFGRNSTYNILPNGNQDQKYKNIECKDVIKRLNAEWFTPALNQLIDDYNTSTDDGEDYTQFKHFNELLIRMIKHFTENYDDKYSNEYELALSIQKIIERGISIDKKTKSTGWCIYNKFQENSKDVEVYFCGKRTDPETRIDKPQFDEMCKNAKIAQAQAKANAQVEAEARAQVKAKAQVEAEANAQVEAEARAQVKAKAQVEAEAKANAEYIIHIIRNVVNECTDDVAKTIIYIIMNVVKERTADAATKTAAAADVAKAAAADVAKAAAAVDAEAAAADVAKAAAAVDAEDAAADVAKAVAVENISKQLLSIDTSNSFKIYLANNQQYQDNFAILCANLLNTLKIKNSIMFYKLFDSIIFYAYYTEPLITGTYLRLNNLLSKTLKTYLEINTVELSEVWKIFKDEKANLDFNEIKKMKNIFKKKIEDYEIPYTRECPKIENEDADKFIYRCRKYCITKLRETLSESEIEQTFVSKIKTCVGNLITKLELPNVKPELFTYIANKYKEMIYSEHSIMPLKDRSNYEKIVTNDIYLRTINPPMISDLSQFVSTIFLMKKNNVTESSKINEYIFIDINDINPSKHN